MLAFNTLRAADLARLPQFRNKRGLFAHTKSDGSDWCPAQWLQALVGELGEFARVRLNYEAGALTAEQYREQAEKELADVAIYLDLLAARALDRIALPTRAASCNDLMRLVAALGEYANSIKKVERGDQSFAEHENLGKVRLAEVRGLAFALSSTYIAPDKIITDPHPTGVDLGTAIVEKFNEVSARVGSDVMLRINSHGEAWAPSEYEGR